MRLLRHILPAAALPVLALSLTAIFSPSGPPAASAANREGATEAAQHAPKEGDGAAAWIHAILCSADD